MKLKAIKFNFLLFMITSVAVAAAALSPALAKEKKEKTIRIKWESVQGIIRYMVQIKDADDAVVLDKTVPTSYVDFMLPPGKYQIRIGAVNKFEKVSFWTDWDGIEIRKTERTKFFSNTYPGKAGIKINGGVCYNMLLPSWNSMYKNSTFTLQYLGYMGTLGFHFGDSKAVKSKNFARFMGIELDGKYCIYAGNNSVQFKSKLMTITGGINLFMKTRLKAPISFYFRLGGGVSYSVQKYTRSNAIGIPLINGKVESLDPYAKAGVSIELNFLYAMSLNIGTDYYLVFYNNKIFQTLHYYAMIGFRI
ncbi:MAG: hypothetical protein KA369_07960 [Spirochaetes bacterium]|nr:hypothetical protein [Spirochaetota bacterium]